MKNISLPFLIALYSAILFSACQVSIKNWEHVFLKIKTATQFEQNEFGLLPKAKMDDVATIIEIDL